MLLLNTLPAFAERTDIIPTGGVWTTNFRSFYFLDQERTFNDLQSACNAAFDFYTKDDAYLNAVLKKLNPPETVFDGSCYPFYLLEEKLSYSGDGVNGYGYCNLKFKNRVRWPWAPDGTFGAQYVCSDFIYGIEIEVVHTPPTCPAPVNGQRAAAADCTQTVSLTPVSGQTEPRPNGSEGDGKSTYDLIAKVTEGNKPKAGMALTFTVAVEAGSGGIPTTPTGRPPGNLSVTSGTTNASGEVKVTFTSPIFAGIHKVKVTCAKCTGTKKDDTEAFNVKVPNLSSFPADTKVPARWNFIGTDKYHNQERFYLTDIAKVNLIKLVDRIQLVKSDKTGKLWGIVGLNDANLPWGGRYNGYSVKNPIPYRWNAVITNGFHAGHRLGVEIDIRTSDKLLSDTEHVTKAFNEVCKDPNVTATILNHYLKDPHFHAYLLGNVDKKLGGSACWQSAK